MNRRFSCNFVTTQLSITVEHLRVVKYKRFD
jgi:hypothetical protein